MPRDFSLTGTEVRSTYTLSSQGNQPFNISFRSDDPGKRKAAAWKDVKSVHHVMLMQSLLLITSSSRGSFGALSTGHMRGATDGRCFCLEAADHLLINFSSVLTLSSSFTNNSLSIPTPHQSHSQTITIAKGFCQAKYVHLQPV